MRSEGKKFGLTYLTRSEVDEYLARYQSQVLGIVNYGQRTPLSRIPAPLWVDIPLLGGQDLVFEVWTSHAPVTSRNHLGIEGSSDGNVLFGSITLPQHPGESLHALAKQAYSRIFGFLDHHAYPHLLRVWHYFPRINEDEDGLERYRSFNVGRHEAFVAHGRTIEPKSLPAASALGSNSGSLVMYFIAGREPGQAVENPRQVSAYQYPTSFGPRSPIFVRSISVTVGGQPCFFISGTASIIGYQTVHQGDVGKQTEETLYNIRTLLDHAQHHDIDQGQLLFKVYLRHDQDMDLVRAKVQAEFGAGHSAIYLHSHICRSDLLLEIEAAYFNDTLQPK